MKLVTDINQLLENIDTLEAYISEGNAYENQAATDLIKNGICFVSYQVGEQLRFAPSRFIGYVNNKLEKHAVSQEKDGRDTNKAITAIIKMQPSPNEILEKKYFDYCYSLGIQPNKKAPFGNTRKFWFLKTDE